MASFAAAARRVAILGGVAVGPFPNLQLFVVKVSGRIV